MEENGGLHFNWQNNNPATKLSFDANVLFNMNKAKTKGAIC